MINIGTLLATLKLDDRTLPSGYRMSTRQLQVQRATRGKALRLNYAASIHRVVALDMADAVFEPGSTEMRPQWKPRIELLLDDLEKAPVLIPYRTIHVSDSSPCSCLSSTGLDGVRSHPAYRSPLCHSAPRQSGSGRRNDTPVGSEKDPAPAPE